MSSNAPRTEPAPPSFPREYERAYQELRGSLTELYAAVGADPSRPQDVARSLGINRNVSWKLGRLIHGADPYQGATHLPGNAGMEIVLSAFARAGAPQARLGAVREAWARLEHVIREHAGDRRGLEVLIASLATESGDGSASLAQRRAAFEAQSAIWGAQARLRMTIHAVAESGARPGWVDTATVGGLCDFRRLRRTTRWPLVQQHVYGDKGDIDTTAPAPIDPRGAAQGGAPLLLDFCTDPPPPMNTLRRGDINIHELGEGVVGNTGAIDALFGYVKRAWAPIHGDGPGEVGEHYSRIDTPVERAQFDLLVHRDLPFDLPPQRCVYGTLDCRIDFPLSRRPEAHLPAFEELEDLGDPPVVASPHYRRQNELTALVCETLGHRLAEFRAFRLTVAYPPAPSMLVLHHPLPVRG